MPAFYPVPTRTRRDGWTVERRGKLVPHPRKIAEGDAVSLGDTSALADPGVVEDLLAGRP